MRYQGKITTWKDDQGFGFVTPNIGGNSAFIHIKSFSHREKRPVIGQLINYELQIDDRGRLNAINIRSAATHKKPLTIGKSNYPVIFTIAFLMLMVISVISGMRPMLLLVIYAATSSMTFFIYWLDKFAAKQNARRIPENTLHLLSLLGGWPGGLLAQRVLRHKSTKKSFQFSYWFTVLLNISLLAIYPWLIVSLDKLNGF